MTYLRSARRHRTKRRWHGSCIWTGRWLTRCRNTSITTNVVIMLNVLLIEAVEGVLGLGYGLGITSSCQRRILVRILIHTQVSVRRRVGRCGSWLLKGFAQILSHLAFLFLHNMVSSRVLEDCLHLELKYVSSNKI